MNKYTYQQVQNLFGTRKRYTYIYYIHYILYYIHRGIPCMYRPVAKTTFSPRDIGSITKHCTFCRSDKRTFSPSDKMYLL